MSGKTSPALRIALITAVTSIVTAFITAGTTIWLASKSEAAAIQVQSKEQEKALTEPLKGVPALIVNPEPVKDDVAVGSREIVIRPMTATASFADRAVTDREGPVKADICVLTSVGSYGGATKGCTLTKTNDGWVLVANGRNSTSACQAMCFDFPSRI